ncbi:MAG: DNA polymerase III subunit gamma/tau [Oscillospiraceae bacterium]|nr:DNA polymerase III subunit gamma/tau [Oscillospiraceae bacterium]
MKRVGQALYRLYRPKSFSEVVGQEHITTVLRNEMRRGHPSHAYLFIGSRGTGKTTCAKLMAKAANCLDLQDGDPCGKCDICRGIDEGSLLDVVEIDAASNNGVDDIRDLREEAVFTPAVAKYRVYIIDEVHMLSVSAFNALLKILEEPPEHVIFILATTEIHKVLPTIVSRCQRFDFHRIESSVIANRLLDVAEQEGITLDDQAAQLIARLSDGGMRDALSLLDVCAASSHEVTVETVSNAAGLVGSAHLFELVRCISKGDTAAVLEQIAVLFQKSMDPQRLCAQLCGHYRDLMLAKVMERPENLINCLPSELPELKAQANKLSLNDILHNMTVLQDASVRMSRSTTKRAELELALATLCDPDARTGYDALIQRIEKLESALRMGAFAQPIQQDGPKPAEEPVTAAEAAEPIAEAPEKPVEQEVKPKAVEAAPPKPVESPKKAAASAGETILPFAKWEKVLDALARINPANYNMLRDTRAFFNGKQVLIDVSNPVILNMLRSNEYLKTNIKQAILEATGERYGLGPYRPEEGPKQQQDPLELFIKTLPQSPEIVIE